MDVTKVQKLNQMAVNLQRHNIVGDKNEAIERAARIYGEENNFSKESSASYQAQQQDMAKDLRKAMFALQHLSNEFAELKHAHTKLEKDFNDFIVGQRRWEAPRQNVSQNSFVDAPKQQQHQQPISQYESPGAVGASDAQARLLAAMEPAKTKSMRDPTKAIDRNNVAPSEVSIDKFFYSGSRR